MGEERKVYKVLVGKPEGKRPLGRQRRRWEDWIRMDLRETGLGCVDRIRLAQDRDRWRAVVSAVMNIWVLALRSLLKYAATIRHILEVLMCMCVCGKDVQIIGSRKKYGRKEGRR
jgi:hypothetical protein